YAAKKNLPIIIDPVGAGASAFRTEAIEQLLKLPGKKVLKGNAAEIMALDKQEILSRGVDSIMQTEKAVNSAQNLLHKYDLEVVVATGEVDFIIAPNVITKHSN